MKKIKAFDYRTGYGAEENTVQKVNQFIGELAKAGVQDVEINITSTGKGVMYTVIWEHNPKTKGEKA